MKSVRAITGNGNVIIAKPEINRMQKSKGGIIIAQSRTDLDLKRAGFGRILSIPINLHPENGQDMPLQVGDFAFFTFASENPIYREALSEIIQVEIPKDTITFTSDAEIIFTIPQEFIAVTNIEDSRMEVETKRQA